MAALGEPGRIAQPFVGETTTTGVLRFADRADRDTVRLAFRTHRGVFITGKQTIGRKAASNIFARMDLPSLLGRTTWIQERREEGYRFMILPARLEGTEYWWSFADYLPVIGTDVMGQPKFQTQTMCVIRSDVSWDDLIGRYGTEEAFGDPDVTQEGAHEGGGCGGGRVEEFAQAGRDAADRAAAQMAAGWDDLEARLARLRDG